MPRIATVESDNCDPLVGVMIKRNWIIRTVTITWRQSLPVLICILYGCANSSSKDTSAPKTIEVQKPPVQTTRPANVTAVSAPGAIAAVPVKSLSDRLRSAYPLGDFEVTITDDDTWKELLTEMRRYDSGIDYARISKYCTERWSDILGRAGLIVKDPKQAKLLVKMKLTKGNWGTSEFGPGVPGGSRKISQGVFETCELEIKQGNDDPATIKSEGGYSFITNASQWQNLTRSTDLPLGALLLAFAEAGVRTSECAAVLPETLAGEDLESALYKIGSQRGAHSIISAFRRGDYFTSQAVAHTLMKLEDASAIQAVLDDNSIYVHPSTRSGLRKQLDRLRAKSLDTSQNTTAPTPKAD